MGFMGSGKSYMGHRLADELSLTFCDLDDWIELKMGVSISQIFSEYGASYFRQLESDMVSQLLSLDHNIIALGGGTPCQKGIIERIKEKGILVLIDVPLNSIVDRLKDDDQRPMITGLGLEELEKKVIHMLKERKPYYDQYDYKVSHFSELKMLAQNHFRNK